MMRTRDCSCGVPVMSHTRYHCGYQMRAIGSTLQQLEPIEVIAAKVIAAKVIAAGVIAAGVIADAMADAIALIEHRSSF